MQSDWIVPSLTCPSSGNYSSSVWVGLGEGTTSDPLYQTGVELDCSSGSASYSAWWEEYPVDSSQSYEYNHTITAGDKMVATVLPNQNGVELELQDFGSNLSQTYPNWTDTEQIYETTPSSFGSGECIVERPEVDGSYAELTDFGTVYFDTSASGSPNKACDLVQGDNDHIISSTGLSWSDLYRIEMYNGSDELASTSGQTSTGSFNVSWVASS